MAALVLLVPQASTAADDLAGAARELARKTLAWNPGPVAVTYRNLSSLPDSDLTPVRREFDAALPPSGAGVPAVEARVTLSENASQFLLVEEVRRGDDSQAWIAAWNRSERLAGAGTGVALEKRLVWGQNEPILDVAFAGDRMLVLSPSGIAIPAGRGVVTRQAVLLAPAKPWPRDLRGRLRVNGDRVQAYLPGLLCNGSVEPLIRLECQPSDEPWVLESGSHAILLGSYAEDRNYFDGRVVTQNGERKTVAPFYTAAAVDEERGSLWLLALVDGETQILDGALQPVAALGSWGSDIVGISARCADGSQVLATRPGDSNEPDAIQAFSIVNRTAVPLAPPVTFAGPVTALWPSTPASALAVARDVTTGKYEAYALTLVCGP